MFGLGPTELIIIAVIVLLIFGARRLPEIGKGLGGTIREFKNIKKDLTQKERTDDESRHSDKEPTKKGDPPNFEARIVDKALEQAPGLKKARDVKKKVEKIKDIVK